MRCFIGVYTCIAKLVVVWLYNLAFRCVLKAGWKACFPLGRPDLLRVKQFHFMGVSFVFQIYFCQYLPVLIRTYLTMFTSPHFCYKRICFLCTLKKLEDDS